MSTTWVESGAGPPRRYYAVTTDDRRPTADGRQALSSFCQDWRRFRDAVDHLLSGGTA